MDESYITHELIMEGARYYSMSEKENLKRDFDIIYSISLNKIKNIGNRIKVTGVMHLYGYKIEGNDHYAGFYDVINGTYYNQKSIENARVISSETKSNNIR